jgi:methyl-accepting chemotaxis protein
LAAAAGASTQAIGKMAGSIVAIADSSDQVLLVEQRMNATLVEMVDSIGQAKQGIVVLAETAIETSSRIFEMDESIAMVDQDARGTVAISQQVMQDARVGKLAVESTLQGMVEINAHSASAAQVIGGLSKKVADIGFILNVIKEVADQTALLSLNAAIISAQAGVHGRGFAVVANEIKSLARRTRESINNIANVIDGVQSDTELAVGAITTASASVKAGEQLALKSNEALEKIVAGVTGATEQMVRIAGVAQEQSASSQVIRGATEQMSRTICELSGVLCFLGDGSEQIMGATGDIAALVRRLHDATSEQSTSSDELVGARVKVAGQLDALVALCSAQQGRASRLADDLDQISTSEGAPETAGLELELAGLCRQLNGFAAEVALLAN